MIARAVVLLALVAGLAACGATKAQRGNRSAGPAVRILVIGDFGVGGDAEEAVGRAVRRYGQLHGADLLLTVGDNDYSGSAQDFRTNWLRSYGWAKRAGVPIAGAVGNHDFELAKGRYQFKTLAMPRDYYSRRVGDVQLLVLDSNRIDAEQTGWLRQRLASSGSAWKVVVFHHPAYSCGVYGSNPAVSAQWTPLIEHFHVPLVLNGHDHNYQRFLVKGTTYIVEGAGGADLYPLKCPGGYPRYQVGESVHGFLYLVADAGRIEGRAFASDGTEIDSFSISR